MANEDRLSTVYEDPVFYSPQTRILNHGLIQVSFPFPPSLPHSVAGSREWE